MSSADGPHGRSELRVRLLGGLEIDGFDPRSLGSRKARALLRRLAAAGGATVGVDDLVSAVWGDAPPARPHDQLSVLVSRLRAVLGAGRLRRDDVGYRLVADWIDVVHLEDRAEETSKRLRHGHAAAAFAVAQAALADLRGAFLPEEGAPWVEAHRSAVDVLAGRIRVLAAEAALAVGEAGAALGPARAALEGDPFDETALRLVMRAESAAGRPAAALAAYQAARSRLAEELGVDPAPETRALHAAVLRGELPEVVRFPGPLLVGRGQHLQVLESALARAARGSAEAVVVEAGPGMGKSALLRTWSAAAAARALVVRGRADELGRELPLQPVVDGLAALLRARGGPAVEGLLGPQSDLLGPLLGRSVDPPPVPVSSVPDERSRRLELFAALSTVLDRVREDRPLVLLVDDLHLAAAGTAEFLAFLLPRMRRLVVVAARRPEAGPNLPRARRMELGPLGLDDAVAWLGPERGPRLHERSGGHPLYLTELARSRDDELPASIVAAVTERVDRLGPPAELVRVAAVLGPEVDVDLLAAVADRPIAVVLDSLEAAARAGLLDAAGAELRFSHDLVRRAVERAVSAARRISLHRTAAGHLVARPGADPLAVARHARLGAAPAMAAEALTAAAGRAAARWQRDEAERLLDQALELTELPAARLARGRLRLARLDLAAAEEDAHRAVEDGAGPEALELAGWVAYYARDYDAAQRCADEGIARTDDAAVRASCLSLAGRIRHTRGALQEAADRLEEAVALAPPQVRGVAQVWQAQLLVHRGRLAEAEDVARRGLIDPHSAHPFAALHGRFTVVMALGLRARWAGAMAAVDDLERAAARMGDLRFPVIVHNMRGWLLRGAGLLDAAAAAHQAAVDAALGEAFLEPRYAGLLDLAEDMLAAGRRAEAGGALDRCAGIEDWTGSMSWRHRARHRLLQGRLAALDGFHDQALEAAREVAAAATSRGDPRYVARAQVLAATARARAGHRTGEQALASVADRFLPLAGPDGWRELAELAAAAGSGSLWRRAERHAAAVLAGVRERGDGEGDAATAVRAQLDRWRP